MDFATGLLPTDTVTTVTTGISSAISADILPIVGVLAFVVGLRWVFGLFNRAKGGRL